MGKLSKEVTVLPKQFLRLKIKVCCTMWTFVDAAKIGHNLHEPSSLINISDGWKHAPIACTLKHITTDSGTKVLTLYSRM